MSDVVVLVFTALLALGVLGWEIWSLWCIARRTPGRQRAMTYVLGVVAGTVLLGMVLRAVLMGAIDRVPVWLVFAVPAVVAAIVLGWRWPVLEWAEGRHPVS